MELKREEWGQPYIQKIGEALLERSQTDPELAEHIEQADCTMDDVFSYIRDKASKVAVNGCACLDCYTVYDMAVKYFKEEIWKKKEKVKNSIPKNTSVAKPNEPKPKKEESTKPKASSKKEEKKETPKPKKETFEDVFGGLF